MYESEAASILPAQFPAAEVPNETPFPSPSPAPAPVPSQLTPPIDPSSIMDIMTLRRLSIKKDQTEEPVILRGVIMMMMMKKRLLPRITTYASSSSVERILFHTELMLSTNFSTPHILPFFVLISKWYDCDDDYDYVESSPKWRQRLSISFDENKHPVYETRDVLFSSDTSQPIAYRPSTSSADRTAWISNSHKSESMRPESTPDISTTAEMEPVDETVQFVLDYTPMRQPLHSSSTTLTSSNTPIPAQVQDDVRHEVILVLKSKISDTHLFNGATSSSTSSSSSAPTSSSSSTPTSSLSSSSTPAPSPTSSSSSVICIKIESLGSNKSVEMRPTLTSNQESHPRRPSLVSDGHPRGELAPSNSIRPSSVPTPLCDIVTVDSDEESVTFVPQSSSRRQRAKRLAAQERASLTPFLVNRNRPPSSSVRPDIVDLTDFTDYSTAELKAASDSDSSSEPIVLLPARIITKTSYYIARFDVPWYVFFCIDSDIILY